MNYIRVISGLGSVILTMFSCTIGSDNRTEIRTAFADTTEMVLPEPRKELTASDIILRKELIYDQHTLEDRYPYRDTFRIFQWELIKERLAYLENVQWGDHRWAVLQNRGNSNGEAPLVQNFRRNTHGRVIDSLGTERYQSVPLYEPGDTLAPIIYARDGFPAQVLSSDSSGFVRLISINDRKEWSVPCRYVKEMESDGFSRIAFVDRTNQNIALVEKNGNQWLIRSMNPATTGVNRPPYMQETPLGIFAIQEKKEKMYFLHDGTSEVAGFAPGASRFCCGAYIHGIPVNYPSNREIEFSSSLGTTPPVTHVRTDCYIPRQVRI